MSENSIETSPAIVEERLFDIVGISVESKSNLPRGPALSHLCAISTFGRPISVLRNCLELKNLLEELEKPIPNCPPDPCDNL